MGSTGKNPSQNNNQQQQESPLAVALRVAENRIYSGNTETAVILDRNGNVLLDKSDGLKDAVSFTDEEIEMMPDAVLTHNHPTSSTFSAEDLHTLAYAELAEIRAVARNGEIVFSMKRDYTQDLSTARRLMFADDYKKAIKETKKTTDKMWNERDKNNLVEEYQLAEKLNKMLEDFRRKWLKDNAKNYGFMYAEEKRK